METRDPIDENYYPPESINDDDDDYDFDPIIIKRFQQEQLTQAHQDIKEIKEFGFILAAFAFIFIIVAMLIICRKRRRQIEENQPLPTDIPVPEKQQAPIKGNSKGKGRLKTRKSSKR